MMLFLRILINIVKTLAQLPLMGIGFICVSIWIGLFNTVQLPRALRWFDCADFYNGRDTTVIRRIAAEGRWAHIYYITIRNPLNYFSYKVLGLVYNNPIVKKVEGNPNVGDTTLPGLYFIEIEQDGKTYYEYYWIYKYSATTCFRFRMGWKIGSPDELVNGKPTQEVFVVSPYHSYSGV